MNLFLQPFHTQQRRVPRAAEPAAGQGQTMGISSDTESPDPPLGSECGSGLRPPRAELKGIRTRVGPDPGSPPRLVVRRNRPRPAGTPRISDLELAAALLGANPHALGSIWGLKPFQSHILPFFLLSPGAKPAAERGAMLQRALARPVPPGAEPPPSSSSLSALPLAPPHLPARYRPRGHWLADSGRWMGLSQRRGARDTCGDVTAVGGMQRRSLPGLHQSPNPVLPTQPLGHSALGGEGGDTQRVSPPLQWLWDGFRCRPQSRREG